MQAELLEFLLIAVSTFVSEDLTCIATGLAAANSRSLAIGIAACTTGIFAGDLLLFAAGRMGRPALTKLPLRLFVSAGAVDRAAAWFQQKGRSAILISRFVPGLRLPTYVAAGVVGMPIGSFLPWFALGALLWTPLLVLASHFFGAKLTQFAGNQTPLLLGVTALSFYAVLRLTLQISTWRGRRILIGWILRRRWEYWPSWAAYVPIVAYCVYLALRFRGPFLFTCCNPGIPASGVIGESKAQILSGLGSPPAARFILLSGLDDPDSRVRRALQLAADGGWPVVVKPDRGQRGQGVVIARNAVQLTEALQTKDDLIVQEYAAGLEFGIFYVRRPSDETGSIISITRKILPEITGDGRNTVEELILADRRAVAMWEHYCRMNAEKLSSVLQAGERMRLVELGTHSRGAVFLDGSHLLTPDLLNAVERISRRFAGFYLGRFDIKCPDEESLKQGKNLCVLELNGATSEPTHIYDPRLSIIAAYRSMFQQWRLEYEIGSENRARGAVPLTARQLIRLLHTGRPESPASLL